MTSSRTLLIYGLGRSGLAAARLAGRQGHRLLFYEQRPRGSDIDAALQLGASRVGNPAEAAVDLCIAAPGVPYEHPDLRALRRRGIETIGEVEWVQRTVPADLIGISGTAGKGSVTAWISRALSEAGFDAPAGGNIDPALADVARPGATLVVELSSFQLERCPTLRPRIAILLNLGSDHLDRHGSLAAYHGAKRKLLANLQASDLLISNRDDPVLYRWARSCPARRALFSLRQAADAWLRRQDGQLMLAATPLLTTSELLVQGEHQLANALAVALACREMGLSNEQIRWALRTFPGLPGRCQVVGRYRDISFIDDSIATRSLAVSASLQAAPAPVVLIAVGVDKGADLGELEELVRRQVCLFIGIGTSGPAFATRLEQLVTTRLCRQVDGEAALHCAVQTAVRYLERHHHGRGTVLLAPLATSFDQFRDYRERAASFQRVVARVEEMWTPCS